VNTTWSSFAAFPHSPRSRKAPGNRHHGEVLGACGEFLFTAGSHPHGHEAGTHPGNVEELYLINLPGCWWVGGPGRVAGALSAARPRRRKPFLGLRQQPHCFHSIRFSSLTPVACRRKAPAYVRTPNITGILGPENWSEKNTPAFFWVQFPLQGPVRSQPCASTIFRRWIAPGDFFRRRWTKNEPRQKRDSRRNSNSHSRVGSCRRTGCRFWTSDTILKDAAGRGPAQIGGPDCVLGFNRFAQVSNTYGQVMPPTIVGGIAENYAWSFGACSASEGAATAGSPPFRFSASHRGSRVKARPPNGENPGPPLITEAVWGLFHSQ